MTSCSKKTEIKQNDSKPNTSKHFAIRQDTLRIIAPAKVNLFLAVGKRDAQEQKHPVLNIMHTIILHDVLFIDTQSANHFCVDVEFVQSDDLDVVFPEIPKQQNIAYKAIMQLAQKLNFNRSIKISVFIEKNIPHGAGLGGGSADAAAALVGAAKIMGVQPDDKRVIEVAQNIGADVAFFLNGGCGLYKGYGEIYDHKLSPINRDIVIVKPAESSLSTAKVYGEFDRAENAGLNVAADLSAISEATSQIQHADGLPMFNNLASAAEALEPELTQVRTMLENACGDKNVLLCGSGACTFALIPDEIEAENVVKLAREAGYWACQTSLANVKSRQIERIN